MKTLMLCPYFGDQPSWMDHWHRNAARLRDHGYEFLIDADEASFARRVEEHLALTCPPMANTGRIWNFRPALGLLYAAELEGFTHWGHTDYDCVYGRVERWYTPELVGAHDVVSNHDDYICGPWTVYRNTATVNHLFLATGEWARRMEGLDYEHGWVEKGFTAIVDAAHEEGLISREYTKFQTATQDEFDGLVLTPDGLLLEDGEERMMAHFRRTKEYPAGCVL